jgi:hypothetical protein
MNYNLIDLDNFIVFASSTQEEAKEFYNWFITSIPSRIQELELAIQTTLDGKNTNIPLDKSPKSLEFLDTWFTTIVETQKPSTEFIDEYRREMGVYAQNLEWILSNKTLSLCFDLGIYLGEVFIFNHSQLKWKMHSIEDMDFHYPVISGFKGENQQLFHCNPSRLTQVLARKLAHKLENPKGLHKLYESWIQWL